MQLATPGRCLQANPDRSLAEATATELLSCDSGLRPALGLEAPVMTPDSVTFLSVEGSSSVDKHQGAADLFSPPFSLLLEVAALPLGQPPLGVRLGAGVLWIKVLWEMWLAFPLLLLPHNPVG